jgi:hypothetical protein
MAGAVIMANNGRVGDFCGRCHNTLGMNLGETVFMFSWPTSEAKRCAGSWESSVEDWAAQISNEDPWVGGRGFVRKVVVGDERPKPKLCRGNWANRANGSDVD